MEREEKVTIALKKKSKLIIVVLPLTHGGCIPGPQVVPEISDSSKPYIYCFLNNMCTYAYLFTQRKHFTASLWHIQIASMGEEKIFLFPRLVLPG